LSEADAALLIAAHGAQGGREAVGNEAVFRLARRLSGRALTSEVAVGFIRGEPDIGTAIAALRASRIIVYPLFVANGYFTRDRLAGLLDQASRAGREVTVLAPLGLDPGLPLLVGDCAARAAASAGLEAAQCNVVLLAHGSKKNPMAGQSTENIAEQLGGGGRFAGVAAAFLEQPPSLQTAADALTGPLIVVGMFSGEGLHGASDVPRQVADLAKSWADPVVFAGVIGAVPGVEELIAASVHGVLAGKGGEKRGDEGPAWVDGAS